MVVVAAALVYAGLKEYGDIIITVAATVFVSSMLIGGYL